MLDTGKSSFAMWVQVSFNDIPRLIQTIPEEKKISIKFICDVDYKLKSIPVNEKITMNVVANNGCIHGFDMPIKGFYEELSELFAWLKEQQSLLNSQLLRSNYRMTYCVLMNHRNELFLPPQ